MAAPVAAPGTAPAAAPIRLWLTDPEPEPEPFPQPLPKEPVKVLWARVPARATWPLPAWPECRYIFREHEVSVENVKVEKSFKSPVSFDRVRSASTAWFAIAAVIYLLWEMLLASMPELWGSSEAREAHVISVMSSTGDFILPTRNGLIPSKPPLFHWIGTALASIFPVAPITAGRWVSVIAALVIVIAVRRLARVLATIESPLDHKFQRDVTLLAPAILLTSYGFLSMAVDARVDMCFSAIVILAVTALIGNSTQGEFREGVDTKVENARFNTFFTLCGLGVLGKGPLGAVLPILIGGAWYLATRGLKRTVSIWLTPRAGWLLFLAIALPWYVAAALRGGEGFVGRQILFENIQRLFGGEFINRQPWYFYGQVILMATLPWSLIFLFGSYKTLQEMRSVPIKVGGIVTSPVARRFLLGWFWLSVLLFSAAKGKRPSYLLPLLPAVALFSALFIRDWYGRLRAAEFERFRGYIHGALMMFIFLAVLTIGVLDMLKAPGIERFGKVPYLPFDIVSDTTLLQAVLGIILVGALFFGVRSRFQNMERPLVALFALWIVVLGTGTSVGWIIKGEFKGFDQMARDIDHALPAGARLTVVRGQREEYFDPTLYYLQTYGRKVELQEPEKQSLQCPGYTLARMSWFNSIGGIGDSNPQMNLVLEPSEWRNRFVNDGDPGREVKLVTCQ